MSDQPQAVEINRIGRMYAHGGTVYSTVISTKGSVLENKALDKTWRYAMRHKDTPPLTEAPRDSLTFKQVTAQLRQARDAGNLDEWVVELWVGGEHHNTVTSRWWFSTPTPWFIRKEEPVFTHRGYDIHVDRSGNYYYVIKHPSFVNPIVGEGGQTEQLAVDAAIKVIDELLAQEGAEGIDPEANHPTQDAYYK